MPVDEADELYGLPLDAFVPERDALAKRLRADGRRDEANEVKALRKPSVAAWAVNQAVRSQPSAARTLWQAGDALIGAQEDLLAGRGDARALRAAADAEREALDELAGAAAGLLTSEGRDLGEGTLERVRETLHAAAIEPDAREDVAAGRVVRERAHAGLGGLGFGADAIQAPPAPRRTRAPEPAERHKPASKRAAEPAAKAKRGTAKADAKADAAERRLAEAARREEERREAAEREAAR
ncbi:MAG TPA: hypothetical protein VHF51_20285, partial [Solirubrobacteraceae bacterium]|nr:hypothetical protein [Solirubrobacteraceae bacterium]